ncbi:MAG: hypothetical protein KY391_06005 [Actinobacteria bacterium]|nr:hypothetical protein [Actinomycetota bacterium]
MESLLTQELHREIENDRLRMAGYRTRVERRRRDLGASVRRIVGRALISAGESICGCTAHPVATVTPLRRA